MIIHVSQTTVQLVDQNLLAPTAYKMCQLGSKNNIILKFILCCSVRYNISVLIQQIIIP